MLYLLIVFCIGILLYLFVSSHKKSKRGIEPHHLKDDRVVTKSKQHDQIVGQSRTLVSDYFTLEGEEAEEEEEELTEDDLLAMSVSESDLNQELENETEAEPLVTISAQEYNLLVQIATTERVTKEEEAKAKESLSKLRNSTFLTALLEQTETRVSEKFATLLTEETKKDSGLGLSNL